MESVVNYISKIYTNKLSIKNLRRNFVMNKAQLISKIAEDAGMQKKDAEKAPVPAASQAGSKKPTKQESKPDTKRKKAAK